LLFIGACNEAQVLVGVAAIAALNTFAIAMGDSGS